MSADSLQTCFGPGAHKSARAFFILDAVKDSPLQAGKVIRGEKGNFANRKKNSFLFYKNLV